MRRVRGILRVSSGIAAALALAACAVPEDAASMELELRTTGSRTAFVPDTLPAPADAHVTLRVINEGEIAHNLVVVAREDAVHPIVIAAYQAIATGYVPTGFEDDIVASTPLVYPGDTVEVAFEMPPSGSYTFVCVFPGHGESMRGTLASLPD